MKVGQIGLSKTVAQEGKIWSSLIITHGRVKKTPFFFLAARQITNTIRSKWPDYPCFSFDGQIRKCTLTLMVRSHNQAGVAANHTNILCVIYKPGTAPEIGKNLSASFHKSHSLVIRHNSPLKRYLRSILITAQSFAQHS